MPLKIVLLRHQKMASAKTLLLKHDHRRQGNNVFFFFFNGVFVMWLGGGGWKGGLERGLRWGWGRVGVSYFEKPRLKKPVNVT